MCGIAGFFGARPPSPAAVASCLKAMGRRGPDHAAARTWVNADGVTAGVLHSRLSIIDLDERSHQPLRRGNLWIALNGELYNHVELRQELCGLGHRFLTMSDTEVLLAVIEQFGWEGLDRCEGMWAAAIYSAVDGSLTLTRDRFGEKPLYLLDEGDRLLFGSEVKFLAALAERRLSPNLDQIFRYLVNGYTSLYKSGETFTESVFELAPATSMRLTTTGRSTTRYWSLPFGETSEMTREQAIAGVRDRLIKSVELRLRSDVPLAFCMSGGVDSNALIAIASRTLNHDVHGFTIVNEDERYDESAMVSVAVRAGRLRHTAVPVNTRSFLPRLRELVRYHDAPVYTISYYAHWLLMEAIAAHGYRVSVSGTAADELFTGYYDHHNLYLHDMHDQPEQYAVARAAWDQHVRPIVRNPFLQDPDVFVKNPAERRHIYLNADRFEAYLQEQFSESFTEASYTDGLLRNRMANELFHEIVPPILHEDDLNAMFFSIENRSPYLDRDLVEFSARIPVRHLITDGRAKSVLREAVRGIAPTEVIENRRKVGFNAPIRAFLDTKEPAVREWLLDDGPIYEHVRRAPIEALIDRDDELPNSESKFLFYFINSKLFLEEAGR